MLTTGGLVLVVRWLQWRLAVFLIALLAQVLAPAGSSLAMARASNDPLFAAATCEHAGGEAGRTQTPGLPLSHEDCCQLCHFVHSGAAPLAPQIPAFLPQIQPPKRIDWIFVADRATFRAQRSRAQARAPPLAA
jgi:membrane-associated protease RseP (regulator of RpoE activity)